MNKSFCQKELVSWLFVFVSFFVPLFLQPAPAAAERGETTSVVPEIIAYRLLLPQLNFSSSSFFVFVVIAGCLFVDYLPAIHPSIFFFLFFCLRSLFIPSFGSLGFLSFVVIFPIRRERRRRRRRRRECQSLEACRRRICRRDV